MMSKNVGDESMTLLLPTLINVPLLAHSDDYGNSVLLRTVS